MNKTNGARSNGGAKGGAGQVIAVVVLAVVVGAGVVGFRTRQIEQRQARELLAQVDAMKQRQDAATAALEARFQQIQVDRYLQPAALVSPDGVDGGRQELAKYRALLADRDKLAKDSTAEAHALFAALPPGRMRDAVQTGESAAVERKRALLEELGRTQNANADAVQAMLDWAETHRSDLSVRGDHLLTANQQELDELRRLNTAVVDSGKAVNTAIEHANALVAQSAQALQDAHRQVEQQQ